MTNHTVYLSLGTNIGSRQENIERACQLLGDRVGTIIRRSAVIETEPWGFQSENSFLNAAVCCLTELQPLPLLHATQQIERDMGRHHKSSDGVYEDRVIDIDILLYDDLHLDTPELRIPHPLMLQRDFVMIPLREIMPETVTIK